MIVVHHLNNSRSQRIVWLLEELETPYEIKAYERDAITSLAPPELRAIHPLGKSPVIEHEGNTIAESGAIVEFICEKFAPHMIPEAGSPDHIRHMELMHFAEGSAMIPILLALYVARLGEAGKPLEPRITSELRNHFAFMESMVRDSGHFVLDELSAVDIMMSFPAEVAVARYNAAKYYPKLAAYVAAAHERPAFKRALEKTAPYAFAQTQ